MSGNRRNRDRRQARRAPFKEARPRILVVTEGAVTEPQYLDGLKKACRNPLVDVEVEDRHGRDPHALVKIARDRLRQAERQARRESDDNLKYDDVWCVFDIDDHQTVADAKQMARDNQIELAISNPAIELWLLLHFRASPGMQHRDQIREMLKHFIPEYDKHVDFEQYKIGYADAVTRAESLDQIAERDGEENRNPTTGMYRLTKRIWGE
ncbi:RloB domain-containing protein [bacterium]|nr:RloB domain-containing protein [bacterium]